MKALLPAFCRPMGYIIIVVSIFLPLIMFLWGFLNDNNFQFYKECFKLLIMIGALMILLALTKNENAKTEVIRIKAIRNAVYLTFIFVFFGMLYRLATGNVQILDNSSFLMFLIVNVLCLEFGIKKDMIDKAFKR